MGYKIAGNLPSDTTTVIQQPADTVYDIDNSYSIGGKTIQLPGGESTTVEAVIQQDVPGSYTVPAPTIEQDATGVYGRLTGAGGGGGTTTVAGQNGGDTYYEFNYNGTQIQIVADGGDGGATGNSGGAGGSGGQARIVSGGGGATNVTATGTYTVAGLDIEIKTYVDGNDGSDGGPVVGGSGGTSAVVGGAGGDGSRTLFEGSNTITTTYTSPSLTPTQYVLPSTWPLSSVKAIIKGGGGGSGGTGDGGANWWAGSGGDGKTITVNLLGVQPGDPLNIYVGGGGSAGSGRNPGQRSNTGFSQGGNGGA